MCYSVFTNSWLLFLIYLHDDHNIMCIERERCALNLLSALMCQASSIFLVPLKKDGFIRTFRCWSFSTVDRLPFSRSHVALWIIELLENTYVMYDFRQEHLICEIWKYQSESFEFDNIRKLQNGKHPIFLDFLVFTLCFSMVSYIIGCHHMAYSHFQSIKA